MFLDIGITRYKLEDIRNQEINAECKCSNLTFFKDQMIKKVMANGWNSNDMWEWHINRIAYSS